MSDNEEEVYGPDGNQPFIITNALSNLMLEHTKYITNLPIFFQFIIWRYTLGSGQVNAELVGFPDPEKQVIWVYQFFKYYLNYPLNQIPNSFRKYIRFFKNPRLFLEQDAEVAEQVIQLFTKFLQNIILGAPPVVEEITVYKISSEYPDLPDKNNFTPKIVHQKPFNSTTIDPQFNFAPFTMEESDCCFYRIIIPKGSHVLYIPSVYHAYPHEREILLPFNSDFDIYDHDIEQLDYIRVNERPFIRVQNEPFSIGEVYREKTDTDITVRRKKMNVFYTRLIN